VPVTPESKFILTTFIEEDVCFYFICDMNCKSRFLNCKFWRRWLSYAIWIVHLGFCNNNFEGVGFHHAIWIANLGFCNKEMFWSHMETNLVSDNYFWRRWLRLAISILNIGFTVRSPESGLIFTNFIEEGVDFHHAIWIVNLGFWIVNF